MLIGLFAFYNAYILQEAIVKGDNPAIFFTGIKATFAGISTIGFMLLFLRWETGWLNQQADYERVLSSTKVDIDRASWVAESLLEWNRESPDKPIPNELLESFTRRLFDWDARVEDHSSQANSLASAILGSASKMHLGSDGVNVEVGRRGIRKLHNE